MAIFAPGALTGPISGSVGGANFAHGPAGPYIRRPAIRTRSATPAQLEHRATLPAARAAWYALTVAQRKGWATTAARVPHTNRLGLTSPIAAFSLYFRFFVQARHMAYDDPTIPPVAITQAPVLNVILVITSAPLCTITVYAPNRTEPSNWQIFMARTYSSNPLTSAQHWRYVAQDNRFTPDVDLTARLLNVFSPPRAGEQWLFRIRTSGDSIMPSPFFSRAQKAAPPPP